ncbi:hypothetical protein DMENIID0001_015290 [Sergentomyia squamirostris]
MASNLVIPVMCTPADSGCTADLDTTKHQANEEPTGGLVASMLSRWLLSTTFYSSALHQHHQQYRPSSTSSTSTSVD